jgi:hypothetical protein
MGWDGMGIFGEARWPILLLGGFGIIYMLVFLGVDTACVCVCVKEYCSMGWLWLRCDEMKNGVVISRG